MTPLDFALILGVALSLHRIWNYEPICAWFVTKLEKIKPLSCAACNAFWVGLATVTLWYFTPPFVLMAVASYLPVRVLVWLYDRPKKKEEAAKAAPTKPAPKLPTPNPVPARKATKTVVIMTALGDFRSSYSIAQDAVNNAKGIALTHPDWNVQLWTMQRCNSETLGVLPANVQHRPMFPSFNMQPDVEDEKGILSLQAIMNTELAKITTPLAIITHDLMFISWFLNFAKAIHALVPIKGAKWFHVCHSMVRADAVTPEARRTLPSNDHTIVTVATGGVPLFKDYYKTDRVVQVPNIRDPRSLGLSPAAQKIATQMNLGNASVVQILPACSTRLEAKGVVRVARVFAHLNTMLDARLVICNPNASGKGLEIMKHIKEQIKAAGLADDKWCFTSEIIPEVATLGLPSQDIMQLMMMYGNVFIFPSISEADSLVLLEARLARQFTVVNASVKSMIGASVAHTWDGVDEEISAGSIAGKVLGHLNTDIEEDSRRLVLRTRSLEVIGNQWGAVLNAAGPTP